MHSYILQDWTTIRAGNISSITQGESGWLDLAPYQDVMFWIDVREYSGSAAPYVVFQTAPIKEDGLFQMMAQVQLSSVTNPTPVLLRTATTPLARWVRWQLTGPGTGGWDATFRVLATCNAMGL